MNRFKQLIGQGRYTEAFQYEHQQREKELIEKTRLGNLMKRMPDEDKTNLSLYINTSVLLCDIIEGLTIDVNDILQKQGNYQVEAFDALIALGKEAKRHRKTVAKVGGEEFQEDFGDKADEVLTWILSYLKNKIA